MTPTDTKITRSAGRRLLWLAIATLVAAAVGLGVMTATPAASATPTAPSTHGSPTPAVPQAPTVQQAPAKSLTRCQANSYVRGIAVKTWRNGDFKVSVLPTVKARGDISQFMNPGGVAGKVWELTQSCLPTLDARVADSVYRQLECHVRGGYLKVNGQYRTGRTWDFESWHPAKQVSVLTACGNRQGVRGPIDYGTHPGTGSWRVYFGSRPVDSI